MRHKKHMLCYAILAIAIVYVLYYIVMCKSGKYHTPSAQNSTGGTGSSLGNQTTPDLRQGTSAGSRNNLYTSFMRRRLGITAF